MQTHTPLVVDSGIAPFPSNTPGLRMFKLDIEGVLKKILN